MDISIEDILDYIEAIDEAVKNDIGSVDVNDRSMILGIISAALAQTSESILQFRSRLISSGRATPITNEQKESLRLILHGDSKLN